MLFRKPLWLRMLLHTALIAGAGVFALPFVWMVGTSMMTDKEIFRPGFHVVPDPPRPRAVSPYVDPHEIPEFARPAQVPDAAWRQWRPEIKKAVRARLHELSVPYPSSIDPGVVEPEVLEGVWERARGRIPPRVWKRDRADAIAKWIGANVTADMIEQAIDACYRRFCVSHVQVRTRDFRQYKLTSPEELPSLWRAESGRARLVPAGRADDRHLEVHYDFGDSESLTLAAAIGLPSEIDNLLQVRVAVRRDETWHRLTAEVEADGKLYRTQRTEYLFNEKWSELILQFYDPARDDDPMRVKTWTSIRPVEAGSRYDHGPRRLLVRLRLERSSRTQAWFAKTINNYREALRNVPFWRYAATSAAVVILNVVLTLLSCSLVAYAFARLNWPGRDLLFLVLLGTMMIPGQVTMIPGFVIIRHLGWYNTLTPLWAFAAFGSAFNIFLLRQFMKGIPKDLEDAARIDGCGFLGVYWHVMLPLVKPTLAAIAIFTFMGTWNDFMGPLIYINDQRLYTLALGLFAFMTTHGGNHAMMMAGSVIMTLPVIALFFFAQKYFIQGVTLTGMKA